MHLVISGEFFKMKYVLCRTLCTGVAGTPILHSWGSGVGGVRLSGSRSPWWSPHKKCPGQKWATGPAGSDPKILLINATHQPSNATHQPIKYFK